MIPAWQAYLGAEKELTAARRTNDQTALRAAKLKALREGGAATLYLHHFVEIVVAESPAWLPKVKDYRAAQDWLEGFCFALRSETPSKDVRLLGDVADALKHSRLRSAERTVSSRDAVLAVESGYGEVPYGEGKYGGTDQVLILAKSGKRPLSTVLQNVVDAWRRVAGLELPPISEA
ncbi:MAG: hypothetical protein EOP85_21655 [Verrucomicrobiaceae bacterium]|nr:MAG: hypothetical protein EOP85_21655 [Verrucomicrobiaceae bacterium]